MLETVSRLALATSIEVWFQDEMRVGQKNSLVYQWAKGTRPRQPKDQRYENAYLFGAVCPSRDTGVAIIMPYANTAAMRKHLEEISQQAAKELHLPAGQLRRYLAENIDFTLNEENLRGLTAYFVFAATMGLIPKMKTIAIAAAHEDSVLELNPVRIGEQLTRKICGTN